MIDLFESTFGVLARRGKLPLGAYMRLKAKSRSENLSEAIAEVRKEIAKAITRAVTSAGGADGDGFLHWLVGSQRAGKMPRYAARRYYGFSRAFMREAEKVNELRIETIYLLWLATVIGQDEWNKITTGVTGVRRPRAKLTKRTRTVSSDELRLGFDWFVDDLFRGISGLVTVPERRPQYLLNATNRRWKKHELPKRS